MCDAAACAPRWACGAPDKGRSFPKGLLPRSVHALVPASMLEHLYLLGCHHSSVICGVYVVDTFWRKSSTMARARGTEHGSESEPLLPISDATEPASNSATGRISRLKHLYSCIRETPALSLPDSQHGEAPAYSSLLLEKVKDKKRCTSTSSALQFLSSLHALYPQCVCREAGLESGRPLHSSTVELQGCRRGIAGPTFRN